MILLTVDEIMMLHDKLLKATGGLSGLRDWHSRRADKV